MSGQETMKTWALEWYQTRIDGKRAKNTQDGYRNLIEHYIIPQLGLVQLSQLTTRRVCSFYARLGRQGLAHNSVWCVHLLLRRILDEACREGRMDRNPVSKINFTQGEIERKTWVSTEQLNHYLEAVQLWGAYPIFYIGLSSGLRQGELISLTWAAFDIQKKLLLLPKRWVQLNERATQILLQERQRYPNQDRIFLDPKHGEPYTCPRLYYIHRQARKEAHIPQMGFRDLQKQVREENML